MSRKNQAASLAVVTASDTADAMAGYRWKSRPLLVFAAHAGDANLDRQRRMVDASRAGYAERDIVAICVVGDSVSAALGPGPGRSATALRSRFGASRQSFRAVLVGKDGGPKLSSASPITATTLFATIDAMPMRRDEMRRR